MPAKKRKCVSCKERKDALSGIICNVGFLCSDDCRKSYGTKNAQTMVNKDRIAKQKKIDKDFALKKRVYKLNDIKNQEDLTQDAFNKMRKAEELYWFASRGLPVTCISCGNGLGLDVWACGHFKTQGGNSRLRYDRINTYIQHNFRCNSQLSGDIEGTNSTHGYKQGLVNRFGDIKAKEIIDYCESNTGPIKRTGAQLKQLRKEFSQTFREVNIKLSGL